MKSMGDTVASFIPIHPAAREKRESIAIIQVAQARYTTRLALKTFTFGAGSKSMSTDNAVLGTPPKRLLLRTLQNADFTGSAETKPYLFNNFNLNHSVMYVNGQAPSEDLSLNTTTAKTCTRACQTLLSGLGIRHGNTGFQITPAPFMKRTFILIFDLTPDGCASNDHTSPRHREHQYRTQI